VATAIRRNSSTGDHEVIFRKLKVASNGVGSLGNTIYTVPFPDISPYEVTEARLPKVAACYIDSDSEFVEFEFTYQYFDPRPNQYIDNDWEVAVARCRFANPSSNFDSISPDWFNDPEVEYIEDHEFADIQPDIVYDPTTGDIYVVLVVYIAPGTTNLRVIEAARDSEDLDVDWGTADPAQSPIPEHNSFHPRIDVGQVNYGDYQNNDWLVGIAYTGWDYTRGWHIRLNYWKTTETTPDDFTKNDVGWDDPMFALFPAGVPSIDIGPPGSDHAAIVWMQAKSDDWANATVMYADTKHSYLPAGQQIGYGRMHPDSTWGSTCSAFPSVAVHEYDDTYESSISFLITTDYVTGKWTPTAAHVLTYNNLAVVTFSNNLTLLGVDDAEGKWDSGTTVEHYFGMTTALTVYENNYWMVWSGFDSSDAGGPTSVWGAYGNTN